MSNKKSKKPEDGWPVIEVHYVDMLRRALFYPANAFAIDLAKLMRRKGFTKAEMDKLKEMGFPIMVSPKVSNIPADYQANIGKASR